MTKTYLCIAICGLIFGAYIFGRTISNEKCKTKIATSNSEFLQQQNVQKEKINVEVYNTNMRDIRNILRAKYTIAE